MKDNNNYNIYKFDIRNKLLKDKKLSDADFYQLTYKRAIEHCKFQIELFNAFSKEGYLVVLHKYSKYVTKKVCGVDRVKYKDGKMIEAFDICMDMVKDQTGLEFHLINENYVYRIPKTNKHMINFFESKKPNWSIKLSKI